jgi:hypothetical protein
MNTGLTEYLYCYCIVTSHFHLRMMAIIFSNYIKNYNSCWISLLFVSIVVSVSIDVL